LLPLLAAAGVGAGEDVFEGAGDWLFAGTALPSGPLTETLGTSAGLPAALVGAAPAGAAGEVPFVPTLPRAPGGTYALVPRTTAPYLNNY